MNTYNNVSGGIRQIVGHEERLLAINGQEQLCMHLMLQLNNYQEGDAIVEDKNHRWEAVSWVYSDQPQNPKTP